MEIRMPAGLQVSHIAQVSCRGSDSPFKPLCLSVMNTVNFLTSGGSAPHMQLLLAAVPGLPPHTGLAQKSLLRTHHNSLEYSQNSSSCLDYVWTMILPIIHPRMMTGQIPALCGCSGHQQHTVFSRLKFSNKIQPTVVQNFGPSISCPSSSDWPAEAKMEYWRNQYISATLQETEGQQREICAESSPEQLLHMSLTMVVLHFPNPKPIDKGLVLLQDNQEGLASPLFSFEEALDGVRVFMRFHESAPFSTDHLDQLKLSVEVRLQQL